VTTSGQVLWLIRSGEGGREVDACVANGVAAVEYPTVGDVRQRTPAQVLEEVRLARDRTDFDILAQRLLDFALEVQVGDPVVTSDGARRQLVFGRVEGPYEWRDDSPVPGMRHLRPVEWLGRAHWDDLDDGARTTLVKYPRTILRITDPALVELAERAVAGGMLPLATTTRPPGRRPTSARAIRPPASNERLCPSCQLLKSRSQFEGDAIVCRDCG
jgi:predicted Mrr-cat superfamily restriction endonuclease